MPLVEHGHEGVLGWKADDPRLDDLDRKIQFGATARKVTKNRDKFLLPVKNQNGLIKAGVPYCTNFAGCSALEFVEYGVTGHYVELSTAFSAWATRMPRGEQGSMVGATIRDFAHAAVLTGMASELAHYSGERDSLTERARVKPAPQAFAEAGDHQIIRNYVISDGDVESIHTALQEGLLPHMGVYLGQRLLPMNSLGMAETWDGAKVNPHSMLIYDADQVNGVWGAWVLNSWGKTFGRAGLVFMSDAWLSKMMDIHVYQSVEIVR